MTTIKDHENEVFDRVCRTVDALSENTVIIMLTEFVVADANTVFEEVRKHGKVIYAEQDNVKMTRYILSLYICNQICNGS